MFYFVISIITDKENANKEKNISPASMLELMTDAILYKLDFKDMKNNLIHGRKMCKTTLAPSGMMEYVFIAYSCISSNLDSLKEGFNQIFCDLAENIILNSDDKLLEFHLYENKSLKDIICYLDDIDDLKKYFSEYMKILRKITNNDHYISLFKLKINKHDGTKYMTIDREFNKEKRSENPTKYF